MFKDDCPHYQSREDAGKDGFTILPKDPKLHWCGDKGEWIGVCDDPCERYEFLNKDVNELMEEEKERINKVLYSE